MIKRHIYQIYQIMALALVLFSAGPIAPSFGQIGGKLGGIAAIVNDEIISVYDVAQRTELFLATSGIEKTPENVTAMQQQVLRGLIDEMMQLQAARDAKVTVEQTEIDDSILRMAQDIGGDVENIKNFLNENDISLRTLETQIAAELAWSYFVRGRFGGQVSISQAEIDESYRRALQALDQTRYHVSEILLAVDNPADEERVLTTANEMVSRLRSGVDFRAVARQFSSTSSAAQGGQMGWVSSGQLDPRLEAAVAELPEGGITDPIRTTSGIYILQLNRRQKSGGVSVDRHIYDLLIVSFDSASETLATQIDSFRQAFTTCKKAEEAAQNYGAVNTQRTGQRLLGTLTPDVRNILLALEAGDISTPVTLTETTDLLIVCDRKDDQGVVITRDQIENNIVQQRLSMMSRRHMRELRRDAVIEYR